MSTIGTTIRKNVTVSRSWAICLTEVPGGAPPSQAVVPEVNFSEQEHPNSYGAGRLPAPQNSCDWCGYQALRRPLPKSDHLAREIFGSSMGSLIAAVMSSTPPPIPPGRWERSPELETKTDLNRRAGEHRSRNDRVV